MEEENRKKVTVWLRPDILARMDGWLQADGCKSRGEFTEKALQFYMGFLAADDTTTYLSRILVDVQRGIIDDHVNRLCTLLFKNAVELNMLCHTMAAHYQDDPMDCRALRAYAVEEVKRTNGQISLDRAVRTQRRLDDGWQGSSSSRHT